MLVCPSEDVSVHAEMSRHLEPFLEGRPVPATASFEKREPPFRAMDDAALRRRLEAEEAKVREVIAEVLAHDPDAVIPWTGRQMPVAKFVPHLRNELAVHRWDIAGDDEASSALLSQPELTSHAVTYVDLDPAARVLVIWGRRPTPWGRFRSHVTPSTLRRLQTLLSGY